MPWKALWLATLPMEEWECVTTPTRIASAFFASKRPSSVFCAPAFIHRSNDREQPL